MTVFEESPVLILGEVKAVSPLLHAGYRARIVIERSLRPEPVSSPDHTRKPIEVAWEEPAPSLAPRLRRGQRIVVAVEPLDSASIWRTRVPDADRRRVLVSLAGAGNGYLLQPSQDELVALEHYLALTQRARDGEAGAVYLARMTASAQPRLALASIRRLGLSVGNAVGNAVGNVVGNAVGLDARLTPAASESLVDALLRSADSGQAGLRGSADIAAVVLKLIDDRRPQRMRESLVRRIASLGIGAPAILHEALGALDGGLDDELVLRLLDSESPERRRVAARWAKAPALRGRMREIARNDPAPSVRAAALVRLLEVESFAALGDVIGSLEDPAAEVRMSAVRSIAALGPEAVDELRWVIESNNEQAARSAVATLSMMGREAHELLAEIADAHPSGSIRALAEISLGRPIGHRH